MQVRRPSSFLRRVLLLDAVSAGAMGLLLLVFAPQLAALLELPAALLRESGIVLLPFAAFVGYLASREHPSRAGVWTVIVLNAVWTIDSIVLLLTDWVAPNALGTTFVIVQALFVGVLAELQYIGLRKAPISPQAAG
ncbi:MAG TPA: hypothetical protein VIL28_05475 [Steroidobacteraceae bacterium]